MRFLTPKMYALFLVLTVFVAGCEPADERAERVRLEKLYAMDNQEIANAFDRETLVEPYNSVRKECEKERMDKNPGKWCEKWAAVDSASKPILDFSRPKF